jgi:hypothetical protein
MERRHQTDQPPEGTAKPTGNARKAGPRPWELEKYIYKEEPSEEKGSSHSDPRLELAQQNHSLHQDRGFIPHDGDSGYGSPAFGLGATSDLYARAFTTSDLGTLAGYDYEEVKKRREEVAKERGPFSDRAVTYKLEAYVDEKLKEDS